MIDKSLNSLIQIAAKHDVGVRFGGYQGSSQFVNSGKNVYRYRGYIEIAIPMSLILKVSKTQYQQLTNKVARELSHELGHFLIAPIGRRYHKDYGIRMNMRSRYSRDKWELDELKALLVEEFLLRECGYESKMRLKKDPIRSKHKSHYYQPMCKKAWTWWRKEGMQYIQTMIQL